MGVFPPKSRRLIRSESSIEIWKSHTMVLWVIYFGLILTMSLLGQSVLEELGFYLVKRWGYSSRVVIVVPRFCFLELLSYCWILYLYLDNRKFCYFERLGLHMQSTSVSARGAQVHVWRKADNGMVSTELLLSLWEHSFYSGHSNTHKLYFQGVLRCSWFRARRPTGSHYSILPLISSSSFHWWILPTGFFFYAECIKSILVPTIFNPKFQPGFYCLLRHVRVFFPPLNYFLRYEKYI